MSIKVIVAGFKGRMGSTAVEMVKGDDELTLAALLDPFAAEKEVDGVPVFTDKADLVGFDADVWVDFTIPAVAYENTHFALENGFAPVVGTTGFTEAQIQKLTDLSKDKSIGGLIAPNFAIGAILLMKFAAEASKYFPDLEIIELHHDKKKDAPSGTAVKTAELIREVRESKRQGAEDEMETLAGARGAEFDGFRIHSVRLPGLVAHQEVIFGAQGEGLTLRHDSYDRISFMSGVNLGIKEVVKRDQLVYGLEVRDALLNRPIHDVDIASSSYPEETKQIFERTVDIGIEHGTVLVLENGGEYEVTTFRTEDVYVDYRRPSSVSFVRSLEEDLKRRDFTVNAFALNENAEVIDKFNGLADLDNRVLRAVGKAEERFNEDALRIMRGLRFAASLDFDIEEKTFEAMTSHAFLLEKISIERSFIEFDKLLLAPHWKKGVKALLATKAYQYLPDFQETAEEWQSFVADYAEDFRFTSSEQAWAATLLALKHDNPRSFLKKWKTSVNFQKTVQSLIEIFRFRMEREVTKQDVYHYGKELLKEAETLRQAQRLDVDYERIAELDGQLLIHDKHEIVVNGGKLMKELGFKPGPDLGRTLRAIENAIVDGELANDEESIMAFVQAMKQV